MQKGALMKQNTTAIYDVDTLNILSPDKIGLTETESGYLEFSYDGRAYTLNSTCPI